MKDMSFLLLPLLFYCFSVSLSKLVTGHSQQHDPVREAVYKVAGPRVADSRWIAVVGALLILIALMLPWLQSRHEMSLKNSHFGAIVQGAVVGSAFPIVWWIAALSLMGAVTFRIFPASLGGTARALEFLFLTVAAFLLFLFVLLHLSAVSWGPLVVSLGLLLQVQGTASDWDSREMFPQTS